jgi:hypothetical protein
VTFGRRWLFLRSSAAGESERGAPCSPKNVSGVLPALRTLAVALATLSVPGAARADSPAAPPASAGVWKKREVLFSQLGFTSVYSCGGLANKLRLLLRASGARADVEVVPIGCGDPSAFAQARLTFFTLAPTTARSTQPGSWRRVTLASRSPRELDGGDCELVERFGDQVLPLFAIRAKQDRTRCVPYQRSGSAIHLRFEVFTEASAR